MEKMIEIKSVYENGEFFGTIQTDDGVVSKAKRYTDMDLFATDLRTTYMDMFMGDKDEARDSTEEVAKITEEAAE